MTSDYVLGLSAAALPLMPEPHSEQVRSHFGIFLVAYPSD
jgi:hypothetical protein